MAVVAFHAHLRASLELQHDVGKRFLLPVNLALLLCPLSFHPVHRRSFDDEPAISIVARVTGLLSYDTDRAFQVLERGGCRDFGDVRLSCGVNSECLPLVVDAMHLWGDDHAELLRILRARFRDLRWLHLVLLQLGLLVLLAKFLQLEAVNLIRRQLPVVEDDTVTTALVVLVHAREVLRLRADLPRAIPHPVGVFGDWRFLRRPCRNLRDDALLFERALVEQPCAEFFDFFRLHRAHHSVHVLRTKLIWLVCGHAQHVSEILLVGQTFGFCPWCNFLLFRSRRFYLLALHLRDKILVHRPVVPSGAFFFEARDFLLRALHVLHVHAHLCRGFGSFHCAAHRVDAVAHGLLHLRGGVRPALHLHHRGVVVAEKIDLCALLLRARRRRLHHVHDVGRALALERVLDTDLLERLIPRRGRRYRCGFGVPDLFRAIKGVEIIAGIFADCVARASFVARKKSSAGCFIGRDFAVPEVVCIVGYVSLTVPDIRFRVKLNRHILREAVTLLEHLHRHGLHIVLDRQMPAMPSGDHFVPSIRALPHDDAVAAAAAIILAGKFLPRHHACHGVGLLLDVRHVFRQVDVLRAHLLLGERHAAGRAMRHRVGRHLKLAVLPFVDHVPVRRAGQFRLARSHHAPHGLRVSARGGVEIHQHLAECFRRRRAIFQRGRGEREECGVLAFGDGLLPQGRRFGVKDSALRLGDAHDLVWAVREIRRAGHQLRVAFTADCAQRRFPTDEWIMAEWA